MFIGTTRRRFIAGIYCYYTRQDKIIHNNNFYHQEYWSIHGLSRSWWLANQLWVFFNSRTNLSPFTKDFRGEDQYDEYLTIFLRSAFGWPFVLNEMRRKYVDNNYLLTGTNRDNLKCLVIEREFVEGKKGTFNRLIRNFINTVTSSLSQLLTPFSYKHMA